MKKTEEKNELEYKFNHCPEIYIKKIIANKKGRVEEVSLRIFDFNATQFGSRYKKKVHNSRRR